MSKENHSQPYVWLGLPAWPGIVYVSRLAQVGRQSLYHYNWHPSSETSVQHDQKVSTNFFLVSIVEETNFTFPCSLCPSLYDWGGVRNFRKNYGLQNEENTLRHVATVFHGCRRNSSILKLQSARTYRNPSCMQTLHMQIPAKVCYMSATQRPQMVASYNLTAYIKTVGPFFVRLGASDWLASPLLVTPKLLIFLFSFTFGFINMTFAKQPAEF